MSSFKKLLFWAVAAWLALAGSANAQVVVTQIGSCSATSAGSCNISVGAGGVPSGSLIFVVVADANIATGAAVTIPIDTASNTYTAISSLNNTIGAAAGNGQGMGYYAFNSAALVNGNTITANFSTTGVNGVALAVYATNIQTSPDPKDASSASGGTSAAPSSSVTTVNAQDLVFGYLLTDGASGDTITQDANFGGAFRKDVGAAPGPTAYFGCRLVASAAAYPFVPTLGTSRDWRVRVTGFKALTSTVTGCTPAATSSAPSKMLMGAGK